jgi:hypothetical protein
MDRRIRAWTWIKSRWCLISFVLGALFYAVFVLFAIMAIAAEERYCRAFADAKLEEDRERLRLSYWSWCLNQDDNPPMPDVSRIDAERCAREYRSWRASDQTVLRYGNPKVRVPCPLRK